MSAWHRGIEGVSKEALWGTHKRKNVLSDCTSFYSFSFMRSYLRVDDCDDSASIEVNATLKSRQGYMRSWAAGVAGSGLEFRIRNRAASLHATRLRL